MTDEQRIAAAEENLSRQLEWHGRFDNRTLLVLGVNTGMLGYVVSIVPEPDGWSLWSMIPFMLTLGFLAASFYAVFIANTPNTIAPADSLLFWGTIAPMKVDEFHKRWQSLSDDAYLRDLNEQVHRNSEIICAKFSRMKAAMRFLLLAIIPWTIAIGVLKTHSASLKTTEPAATQRM